MTVSAIRKKLSIFIENASDEKIKEMYSMIEPELNKNSGNGYTEEFKIELDRRAFEYSNGISKPITREESKKRVKEILNSGK